MYTKDQLRFVLETEM